MTQKRVVYFDTNIIIQAHRIGCWKSIAHMNEMHTVERVVREVLGGDKNAPGYILVDQKVLESTVIIHEASLRMRVQAALDCPTFSRIDEGEQHLLAYLHSLTEPFFYVATADKTAVFAACELGLIDRLLSLEELMSGGRQHEALRGGYGSRVLSEWKTMFLLR